MAPASKKNGPLLETAESTEEIRTAILSYLRSHRAWYARWSTFYSLSWNTSTLLIVILGAATSILAAAGDGLPQRLHLLVIVLPAISSLLAALLVQFKQKEMCRLREAGRLTCEELICKAFRISSDENHKDALAAAIQLREAAHNLERQQLLEYMGEATSPGRGQASTQEPKSHDGSIVKPE